MFTAFGQQADQSFGTQNSRFNDLYANHKYENCAGNKNSAG